MPGPPPKAAGARARRNKASTASTIKANPDLEAPDLPRHPGAGDGEDWHELTRAWWGDIWQSPMAPEFDRSDVHGLYALAMLVDEFWTTRSGRLRAQIGAEIRLESQRFGLSPLDRRRLQWQIEETEEKQARGDRRRGREDSKPEGDEKPKQAPADPRDVLRLVQ